MRCVVLTGTLLLTPCAALAQGLPELAGSTSFKLEELVPADIAEHAKRKWMWSLADFVGKPQQADLPSLGEQKEKLRVEGWMIYGRAGILRWQNDMADEGLTAFSFGLRHTPPKLPGSAYIGVYRRF